MALVATLGVGVLAGILVGTGLAAFTARGLSETSWVMRFQLEDRLFAKAMPPLMLSKLLALIAACVLARGHSRLLLGISVLFMVLVVTIGFEVPLNKQIQSWTPGSAPSVWQRIRDLWLQRHLLRTISSVLGFISALIALVVWDRLGAAVSRTSTGKSASIRDLMTESGKDNRTLARFRGVIPTIAHNRLSMSALTLSTNRKREAGWLLLLPWYVV